MMWNHQLPEITKEKMARYEREAELQRALPRHNWRHHTARVLRRVALWLEPNAPYTRPPRRTPVTG